MKMRGTGKLFVALTLALCFILTGFTDTEAKKLFLSFGGGSATGVYYFCAGGFSHIIEKYVPEVKSTPISTEASVENLNLLERKKIELAFAEANAMLLMIREGRLNKVRLIGAGYDSPTAWIVRAESPIKTLEDFRGKKIGVGAVGSGTIVGNRAMLEAGYGITFNDIKPQMLAFGPMGDGLRDGTLDAIGIPAGLPTPMVTDLATSIKIRIIPMEKDAVERVMKKYAYIPSVIPANTYPNQPNDIHTMAHLNAWVCAEGLPTDLVYQMVKAVYDHPKEVAAIHPAAKEFNFGNIYKGLNLVRQHLPYHPGAIKYFKEKGVWKE